MINEGKEPRKTQRVSKREREREQEGKEREQEGKGERTRGAKGGKAVFP